MSYHSFRSRSVDRVTQTTHGRMPGPARTPGRANAARGGGVELLEPRRLLSDVAGAGQWEDAAVFGVHRAYNGSIESQIDFPGDSDLFRFGPFAGSMGGPLGAKIIPDPGLTLTVKVYHGIDELAYEYGPATADPVLAVPITLTAPDHFVEVSSDGSTGGYRIDFYAELAPYYDFDTSPIAADSTEAITPDHPAITEFIQYQGDINVHPMDLQQGQKVIVSVSAHAGATLQPAIRLLRSDSEAVTVEDLPGSPTGSMASFAYEPATAERVYLEVTDANGVGIGDYTAAIDDAPSPNARPVVQNLVSSPSSITRGTPGGAVTLTASGVNDADPGDTVEKVELWVDLDKSGTISTGDFQLPDAIKGGTGEWSQSVPIEAEQWEPGTYFFLARAWDGEAWSSVAQTSAVVLPEQAGPPGPPDFNGDGHTDLVYRGQDGIHRAWLMDRGVIKSAPVLPVPDNPNVTVGAIGDFDGDGRTDLVLRNNATGDTVIWLLDGVSVRQKLALPGTDSGYRLHGAGDFDGDGDLDLVLRHSQTNVATIWMLDRTTPAGFKGIAYPGSAWQIEAVRDLNQDGQPDILWSNRSADRLSAWFMQGFTLNVNSPASTFRGLSFPRESGWELALVHDFDEDGSEDMLWHDPSRQATSIWAVGDWTQQPVQRAQNITYGKLALPPFSGGAGIM